MSNKKSTLVTDGHKPITKGYQPKGDGKPQGGHQPAAGGSNTAPSPPPKE